MRFVDRTGQTYGRLTVLGVADRASGRYRWRCRCLCGNETVVAGNKLVTGSTRSCGCLRTDAGSATGNANRRHGHARNDAETPTYRTWVAMRRRCRERKGYADRGITVCDRWKTFENFLADMGERPDGKTIDRKNVNGNYEPSNCRWATAKEQANNRRIHGTA